MNGRGDRFGFLLLAISIAVLASFVLMSWYIDTQQNRAIGTDGRYHLCGLVTEQGVTSHLSAYHKRCAGHLDHRP